MSDLRTNAARVLDRIEDALARTRRAAGSVQLVAVTKTMPAGIVAEAVRAGLRVFGENKVQEAAEKIPRVAALLAGRSDASGPGRDPGASPGGPPPPPPSPPSRGPAGMPREAADRGAASLPAISWHLIGHLQSNKAKQAVRHFDLIHSVDDAALAGKIDRAAELAGRRAPVLVQVNLAGETTKSGIPPEELRSVVDAVLGCAHLELRGLMTIPPLDPSPEHARPRFAALRELGERVRLWTGAAGAYAGELSMGMTDDFEVAIEEGATIVRVGRALFGERRARP